MEKRQIIQSSIHVVQSGSSKINAQKKMGKTKTVFSKDQNSSSSPNNKMSRGNINGNSSSMLNQHIDFFGDDTIMSGGFGIVMIPLPSTLK
jgi:hypothetical protein